MSTWLTIILAGILTYVVRLSFILLYDKIKMPDLMQRALRFVPASVLSAFFLPELLLSEGTLDFSFENARLLAGILAIVVAWRTKSVTLTIVFGMLTLWLLQALVA